MFVQLTINGYPALDGEGLNGLSSKLENTVLTAVKNPGSIRVLSYFPYDYEPQLNQQKRPVLIHVHILKTEINDPNLRFPTINLIMSAVTSIISTSLEDEAEVLCFYMGTNIQTVISETFMSEKSAREGLTD